jgi:hypothetical protein
MKTARTLTLLGCSSVAQSALTSLLVLGCTVLACTGETGAAGSGGTSGDGGSTSSGGRTSSGGSTADGGSSSDAGSTGDAGAVGAAGSPNAGARCLPAEGTSGSPKTIYEALDLINGLPHPVDLPCFLESLDRPLGINASFNIQSAQPALGKRSPRIFLMVGEKLSLSLVPGAEATLEFGERDASNTLSVKAEVHFPIEGKLAPEDAFSRLAPDPSTGLTLDDATSCGVCHDNEELSADYPFRGAFISAVVKPTSFFILSVDKIRPERETCDSEAEPERCAVYQALFDFGEVVEKGFP